MLRKFEVMSYNSWTQFKVKNLRLTDKNNLFEFLIVEQCATTKMNMIQFQISMKKKKYTLLNFYQNTL